MVFVWDHFHIFTIFEKNMKIFGFYDKKYNYFKLFGRYIQYTNINQTFAHSSLLFGLYIFLQMKTLHF